MADSIRNKDVGTKLNIISKDETITLKSHLYLNSVIILHYQSRGAGKLVDRQQDDEAGTGKRL